MKRLFLNNKYGYKGVIYFTILALLFISSLPLHSHIPYDVSDKSLLHAESGYVGKAVIHLALPDLTVADLDSLSEFDFSEDLLHKKLLNSDLPIAFILLLIILLPPTLVCLRVSRLFFHSVISLSVWGVRPPQRAPPL